MLDRIALIVIFVSAAAARSEDALDLGTVTEKHVMVPMRDGVKLSVYLYFPEGKGPWPALYEQRYLNLRGADYRKHCAKIAAAGYVVAVENFRGAQRSEGTWVGYRALGWGEKKDGYDTVEWLAAQPWCTGKVGTMGVSQAGFAQNFLAVTRPPHLVAQFMVDTGLSLFHEGYRIGGITRPERFKTMAANCRVPAHNNDLMREWFAHPNYDDYWKEEDCTRHFDKMNVPCLTVGSWFDFMNVGSVESYMGRQHRGGPNSCGTQKLVIGPWLHSWLKPNKVGDLAFPDNAAWDVNAQLLRWFDHYLKGVDNGVEKDPVVRYYAMGATGEKGAPGNVWRTASDWPIRATNESYYLHDKGELIADVPSAKAQRFEFVADPKNPAKIPGTGFPGAKDAREFEAQPNVLTFTTAVLKDPVEWTGKVKADLWVTSDAKDTDFIVRVSDVYPDGRSILLIDYVRRARYRDGFEKEVLLVPKKPTQVAFDIGWLSQVFNRGHRIRVTVASTGAPFYEPNPNTGEPLTIEPTTKTVVAHNAILQGIGQASRIVVPVRTP